MFKRLFLLLTLASCQLMAMELPREVDAFDLPLNKNVRIMLYAGRTIVWPAESHQLDPLERSVAQRSYTNWEKGLQPFLEKAKIVLKGDNTADQVAFFDEVVTELTKPGHLKHPMGYIVVSTGRLEGVLLNVVLYCQAQKQGKGTQGIWDTLCVDKEYIDKQSFKEISVQNKQLLYCMFKDRTFHHQCLDKKACQPCTRIAGVSHYFANEVVDTCCQDKVNLGNVCELCSKRIKRALYVKTRLLVYGLCHFGVPMEKEKEQHKRLLEWAQKF